MKNERLSRNRTSKPVQLRSDIAEATGFKDYDELMGDRYDVAENDSYAGNKSGDVMPKELYPSGKVPARVWNEVRPHKPARTSVCYNRDHRNAMD